MREVIYYDCNASIRTLLTQKLKSLGLSVILPERLDTIENDFRRCRHSALFIVDLSRRPDFLPILQSFVGNYISDPSHCILTSVNPSALAHYLPSNINACFFKHVVERPFKTPEFLSLIETECLTQGNPLTATNVSLINSSVEQITDPHAIPCMQEDEKERINDIVQSISRSINLSEVVNTAAEGGSEKALNSPTALKPPLFGPAPATVAPLNEAANYKRHQTFRTLPINLEPLPPLPELQPPAPAAPSRPEQPVASPSTLLQSRISRKHGPSSASHPHAHTAPGMTAQDPLSAQQHPSMGPMRSVKATLDAIRGTSSGSKDSLPRVSANPDTVSATSYETLSHAPSASHPENRSVSSPSYSSTAPEKDEDVISIDLDLDDDSLDNDAEPEHTMLISPENVDEALKALQTPVNTSPISNGILSETMWCDLLRRSFMRADRLTLEIGNASTSCIVILEMGALLWAEPCSNTTPCKASDFLETLPNASELPIAKIKTLLSSGMDLANVLVNLDIFDKLIPRFENFVLQTLDICVNTPNLHYTLFTGLSPKAESLLTSRIALSLPIFPTLFERCRQTSITLGSIQYRKYHARPDRTPLNASIRLNDDEKKILDILTTPRTFNNLSRLIPGEISAPLSRLVMFDFVDIIL